jgi:hypothetical protein
VQPSVVEVVTPSDVQVQTDLTGERRTTITLWATRTTI